MNRPAVYPKMLGSGYLFKPTYCARPVVPALGSERLAEVSWLWQLTLMNRVGQCRCCGAMGRLVGESCASCDGAYGPRVAGLVVKARHDLKFAERCVQEMSPEAAASFIESCHFNASELLALRGASPRKCTARPRRLRAVES